MSMTKDPVDSVLTLGLVWFMYIGRFFASGTNLESWHFVPKHQSSRWPNTEYKSIQNWPTFFQILVNETHSRLRPIPQLEGSKYLSAWHIADGIREHNMAQTLTSFSKDRRVDAEVQQAAISSNYPIIHIPSDFQAHRTLALMNLKGVVGTSSLQTSFKNALAASATFIPAWWHVCQRTVAHRFEWNWCLMWRKHSFCQHVLSVPNLSEHVLRKDSNARSTVWRVCFLKKLCPGLTGHELMQSVSPDIPNHFHLWRRRVTRNRSFSMLVKGLGPMRRSRSSGVWGKAMAVGRKKCCASDAVLAESRKCWSLLCLSFPTFVWLERNI